MIIIFGWLKEYSRQYGFVKPYCYNCGQKTLWILQKETEWISFFAVKTIPFIFKYSVFCERCGDKVDIPAPTYLTYRNKHPQLQNHIEITQLGRKTSVQQIYLTQLRNMNEDANQK